MDTHTADVVPKHSFRERMAVVQSTLGSPHPSKSKNAQKKVPRQGKAQRGTKGTCSFSKLLIPFLVHGVLVAVGLVLYVRLHRIDLESLFDPSRPAPLARFDFVSADAAIGSVVEIVFWAFVATSLRWMRVGIIASRSDEFQPSRHLVEYSADLLTTPIVAAVIVYALRSWRLTSGETVNITLEGAPIGWYVVIGFLLGFFDQTPRLILNRLRKHAFSLPRDLHKPKSERNIRPKKRIRKRSRTRNTSTETGQPSSTKPAI